MKTVWIVDGAYLFNFGKTHNCRFDYIKLKNELEKSCGDPFYESYFLNSKSDSRVEGQEEAQEGFHTWIKSAPPRGPKMRVQLYNLKDVHNECPKCGHSFTRRVQKGVDVGIATLIIKLAVKGVYDRLILSAGDGDFEDAISYVKSDLHKEIWFNGTHASLSTDLQSYADNVIWLEDLVSVIEKA